MDLRKWCNDVKCFHEKNYRSGYNLQVPRSSFWLRFLFSVCRANHKTTVGACSLTAMSWGSTVAERLGFCDPAALRELSHLFSVAVILLWGIMQCVAGNEPWGESQQGTTSLLTCLNPVDHKSWLEFWLVSTAPSESRELRMTLTAQSVITYKMWKVRLREESRHIANRFWMMVAQGHDCFTLD